MDKHDVSAAAVMKQDLVVCWDENLERARGIKTCSVTRQEYVGSTNKLEQINSSMKG